MPAPETNAKTVLIVDDDPQICLLLARALGAMCGRACLSFGSAEELRHVPGVAECDTAILDYRLNGPGTGLDACRYLRRVGFRGRIVFFTGDAEVLAGRPELMHLQVLRVFAKPTEIHELLALVCD